MGSVPTIDLNNGQTIPQLGFGVFQIDPAETADAVRQALEIGYRHIDTAEMYGNEAGVGQGVRDSGLDRDEVFITSKLNNGFHEPDTARRAFDQTLEELGTDHVDLFLIHWPLPTQYGGDFVSTWKVLEEFYLALGRCEEIMEAYHFFFDPDELVVEDGHLLFLESPERFNPLVAEFLA